MNIATALRAYLAQCEKDDGDTWTLQERRDDMRAALAAHDAAVSAGGCVADGAHVVCNGDTLATAHGLTLAPLRAARIAACVNACAGIADPSRLVPTLRNVRDVLNGKDGQETARRMCAAMIGEALA